jgi:hypothetical protein
MGRRKFGRILTMMISVMMPTVELSPINISIINSTVLLILPKSTKSEEPGITDVTFDIV